MQSQIAGVSLLSECDFLLCACDAPHFKSQPVGVNMPRRSVYLMTGLSRWHLQHAVLDIPADRVSLTFRTVDKTWTKSNDSWLWRREWDELTDEELANAHM